MKLADIEVNKDYVNKWGERFTVLDKGNFERRVYSGGRADFGGHISKGPSVKVFWLNRDGTPSNRNSGPRQFIASSQVVSTFEEWDKQHQESLKVQQRLAEEFAALKTLADRLAKVLGEAVVEAQVIARRAGMNIEITLTSEQANNLIEALS